MKNPTTLFWLDIIALAGILAVIITLFNYATGGE